MNPLSKAGRQTPALPRDFLPYFAMEFCGNYFSKVTVPILMTDAVPILVGRGIAPLIWITGPAVRNHPKGQIGWVELVKANKAVHTSISVIHPSSNRTIVSVADKILVDCETKDDNSAIVRTLDLRPVGLVIYGNLTNLTIGVQRFSQNTFSDVEIAFAFTPNSHPN